MGAEPQAPRRVLGQRGTDGQGRLDLGAEFLFSGVLPLGDLGLQLGDDLAGGHGPGDKPAVQVPQQPVTPDGLIQLRVTGQPGQAAERLPDGLDVGDIERVDVHAAGLLRIRGLAGDRDVFQLFAEHADRVPFDAHERTEELLHGLVPLADAFLVGKPFLGHRLDRGRRAHRHHGRITPGSVLIRYIGLPFLLRPGQMDLQPPHQQGDVAAQDAPVRVDFVQDQEPAAVVGEDRLAVGGPDQEVLQHHVVGQQDVRRALAEPLAVGLGRAPVVFLHADRARQAGFFQVLLDAQLLVVGQGVHRVDEDGRQARLAELGGVLPGVLDDRQEKRLGLAAARAGGHDDGPRRRGEQFGDGLGLVQIGRLALGAVLHHLRQLGIQRQLPPRRTALEGPVGLVERLLGQEATGVEFGLQRRPQLRVLGAELRAQVVGVFVDDVVEGFDGVEAHIGYSPNP